MIAPVIGLGTLEDIEENGLAHTRVLSIPFPGANYPTEADLIPAPGCGNVYAGAFNAA